MKTYSVLFKWVSYFIEGVLLFAAYILCTAEVISYFDGINRIKVLSFILALVLWFFQFYANIFVLKKYPARRTKKRFFEQRFLPEATYFLYAFTFVLMLRALIMNIPVGNIGRFLEIESRFEDIFVAVVYMVVITPIIVSVPFAINYLLPRAHLPKKYEGIIFILLMFLLLLGYGFIKPFIDPPLDYWTERIFDHPRIRTLVRFLLGSPILYYFNTLLRGSRFAEKWSKI